MPLFMLLDYVLNDRNLFHIHLCSYGPLSTDNNSLYKKDIKSSKATRKKEWSQSWKFDICLCTWLLQKIS